MRLGDIDTGVCVCCDQDAPGGGVTAGLSTARTVCRVVIRDLSGKNCWESSVLYSPPCNKKGSSLLSEYSSQTVAVNH